MFSAYRQPIIKFNCRSPSVVGLAMCSFIYTWEGKTLFLNDLFVSSSHRSHGIGKTLFKHILKYAKDYGYNCMDFYVVNWNPATKLYEKMGAINLTSTSGVLCHHLYKNVIDSFDGWFKLNNKCIQKSTEY